MRNCKDSIPFEDYPINEPMTLMDIMGISKFDTLQTYIRVYEATKRTAVKKFNDLLFPKVKSQVKGTVTNVRY